jgi:DNA-binding NarL/FixJ family response regulator
MLFCELLASDSSLDEGLDAVKALHQRIPETLIVVLTALHDRSCVSRALEAGARAYIPKTYKSEIVLGAVRLVLSGGVYVPSDLFDSVEPRTPPRTSLAQAPVAYKGPLKLTRRQHDVLTFLTQGCTNRDIAREIDVKEGTVKIHVAAIFKALGVANRTQAVIVANRLGILDDE